jgi:hypothetical protein
VDAAPVLTLLSRDDFAPGDVGYLTPRGVRRLLTPTVPSPAIELVAVRDVRAWTRGEFRPRDAKNTSAGR